MLTNCKYEEFLEEGFAEHKQRVSECESESVDFLDLLQITISTMSKFQVNLN